MHKAAFLVILGSLTQFNAVLGGQNDKIDQLEIGYTNLDMNTAYDLAEIKVEFGQVLFTCSNKNVTPKNFVEKKNWCYFRGLLRLILLFYKYVLVAE